MNTPEAASPVPRLQVRDLTTTLVQSDGEVPLVRGVSFDLHGGQTLALVGESGSGKSLTALSLMRLLARNARWECGGQAWFTDATGQTRDLLQLNETEMRQLRGHQMAMIFQEPMTCLNPVLTVGEQIAESVRLHWGLNPRDARQRALQALEQVEIPAARQRLDEYPHQLSGGMRQRVMIAMAMVCEPQVLIADEPTTALDVTIQAQILLLMSRLQRDTGMSMLFITHNLGVVAHHAERVAVMYAGQVVEQAPVHALFAQPAHPYTQGLLACLPGRARLKSLQEGRRMALQDIAGQAPAMDRLGAGCSFADRCGARLPICSLHSPIWRGDAAHGQACHLEQPS
jgi:peptide/nickel transport system ATP-binding protein